MKITKEFLLNEKAVFKLAGKITDQYSMPADTSKFIAWKKMPDSVWKWLQHFYYYLLNAHVETWREWHRIEKVIFT